MTLDLDARQRAMLAEMRVTVWSPAPGRTAGSDGAVADTRGPANGNPAQPALAASANQMPAPVSAADAAPVAPETRRAPAMPSATAVSVSDVDALDWAELAQAVRSCQACGLCEGRKAAVFSVDPMPQQADWLVVGDPPDALEERSGAPFAGPPGQLLDNMLRAVQCARDGHGRGGARVTNIVKCRPGVARNPQPDELARCAVYLRREIALTRPRVILALGRFAAWSLLSKDYPDVLELPFGQLRGQVYRHGELPVIVTYHPAKLLRTPLEKASAWADLCLARSLLQEPG